MELLAGERGLAAGKQPPPPLCATAGSSRRMHWAGALPAQVAAVDEPKLHLWDTGVTRITRHPQAFGQLIWCIAHTAWCDPPPPPPSGRSLGHCCSVISSRGGRSRNRRRTVARPQRICAHHKQLG